jgi:hypothetical protein
MIALSAPRLITLQNESANWSRQARMLDFYHYTFSSSFGNPLARTLPIVHTGFGQEHRSFAGHGSLI